ncbi:MAG: VWA domain-containing protein [Oscillospiraceae bacterium]|jgi:hypothetical protein|nr:VWA domain-containing protein [Oscillospiraceae bacterium]
MRRKNGTGIRRRGARGIAAALTALLLLFLFADTFIHSAMAANRGQFDLDVVLVIDCSGSMRKSDPDKLATTAANLFVDMCRGSETKYGYVSDSRFGYVLYSQKIEGSSYDIVPQGGLAETRSVPLERELKKALANITYNSNADTDTALGLETARDMLANRADSSRKPVVILLSDGNTDLSNNFPGTTRTTEQSRAALGAVKDDLAAKGFPVYTIGFNYDGSMDTAVLADISQQTNAKPYETNDAGELPGVLQSIYAHLTGAQTQDREIIATGEPQTETFDISNNSVYKATVSILSHDNVDGVSLTAPDGVPVSEGSELTIDKDPNNQYTLLTLYEPMSGEWTLEFTGSKDSKILINMIYVYDFAIRMAVSNASTNGADVSWWLEYPDGTKNDDPEVIQSLAVALCSAEDDSVIAEFPAGSASEHFDLASGDYTVYLTAESAEINRVSNTEQFTVPDSDPIALRSAGRDTFEASLWVMVPFFDKETSFELSDFIKYKDFNRPLDVDTASGEWEDFFDLTYNKNGEEFYISALKGGTGEATITVEGADGSAVTLFVDVKVSSGLPFIIGLAVLLLAAGALCVLLILRNKPYLDMPMRSVKISVTPPDFASAPPETALNLPHVKQIKSLRDIVNFNFVVSGDYLNALAGVDWFLDGAKFFAKSKLAIEVTIPQQPGWKVTVNRGAAVGKSELRPGGSLKIDIARGDEFGGEAYEILLGNAGDGSLGRDQFASGGGSDPFSFGGNNGGADVPFGFGGSNGGGFGSKDPFNF